MDEPGQPGSPGPAEPTGEPPDPNAGLRRKARVSILILGARTVLQELFVFGGTILLMRRLSRPDYGVFVIVQFLLQVFRALGDAGLGASLIQRQGTPSRRELSTVWWSQLILSSVVIAVIWFAGPWLLTFWDDVPDGTIVLLRAMSFSLLLNLLRGVPALLMERTLRFLPLSLIELGGTAAFYTTAVLLAYDDRGTAALVGGVLAQGVVMLGLTMVVHPWAPALSIDLSALREMLRFALPFQGKVLMGILNGAVTPVLAGSRLGMRALGENNFAMSTASFPLHLVSIIGRISFPLFSRFAHDRRALAEEIRFSVKLCGTVAIGFTVLFVAYGPALVQYVFSPKWEAALPALYIYSSALGLGFLAPIVAAALDGIGRPKVVFQLSIGWTLLNFVMVWVVLEVAPDVTSYAAAYVVHMIVGNLAIVWVLRREIPGVRVLAILARAAGPALVVGFTARTWVAPHIDGVLTLVPALVVTAVIYIGITVGTDRPLVAKIRRKIEERRARRPGR